MNTGVTIEWINKQPWNIETKQRAIAILDRRARTFNALTTDELKKLVGAI